MRMKKTFKSLKYIKKDIFICKVYLVWCHL